MMLNECDAISVVHWTKVQILSSIFQVFFKYIKCMCTMSKLWLYGFLNYQSSVDLHVVMNNSKDNQPAT